MSETQFENITIFIPSKGRAKDQVTIGNLPNDLLDRTVLLVDYEEWDDYLDEFLPVFIEPLPPKLTGIGNVRQWAIENCKTPYAFLLDDDMVFCVREELDIKLRQCEDDDVIEMFSELINWLDVEKIPLVGVSARQGNNHVIEDYREATRQMNFHGIDVRRFQELGLKFNLQEVMEDFRVTLDLLTQGISNRVFYRYCWNQKGSNSKGGCSTYRTFEVQKNSALALEEAYPDFVTVVIKKNKSTWEGMKERYDVRVQWKKAYEQGLKDNEL